MSGLGRGWVHFPDGTYDAWFDYATAIVGMNAPFGSGTEYEVDGDRVSIGIPLVARIHERAHVLQAATFPWFLQFCTLWRQHVLGINSELMAAQLGWNNIGNLPHLLSRRCLREGDELLSRLDATSEAGFSVLHMLESHAFYSQLSSLGLHSTESVEDYLRNNNVEPRYRFVYDWTRAHLGDEQTLAGFGAIVAAAFCFRRPTDVFEDLVKFLTLFGVERGARLSILALIDAARERGFKGDLLGLPSGAVKLSMHDERLPIAAQCRLVLELSTRRADTVEEVLATQEGLAHAVAAVQPTTLYQPDEDSLSAVEFAPMMQKYRNLRLQPEDSPHGLDFMAYKVERFLMGISQRLIANYSSANSAEAPPHLRWLKELSWSPQIVYFPGEFESEDPDQHAEIVNDLCAQLPLNSAGESDADYSRVIWALGRVQLIFDIDTPLEAWQHPWVRSVIQAIEQRCPAFPLLLTTDQTFLWFASLSDAEGISAQGSELGRQSVKLAFYRFLDAVEQLQERTVSDFSSLVQRNMYIWSGPGTGAHSPWRGKRDTTF